MAWLEKDLDRNKENPVRPGTVRSFSSRFHDPGQPQIEVIYLDEHRAKIQVPNIAINTGQDQPLEKIIEKESFVLKYRRLSEPEQIFYEAIYRDE